MIFCNAVLQEWATVAADDCYSNGKYIETPYSGHGLSIMKDTSNRYLSSCHMIVEQAPGFLVCRFGIFGSALRYELSIDTLIKIVTYKLHNFIIDTSDDTYFHSIPFAEENIVDGSPIIQIQNLFHIEQNVERSRRLGREDSMLRDKFAERLNLLEFMRPPPTR